jgi:hypothetical protein
MGIRSAGILLVVTAALVCSVPAFAWTPAQNAAFAKQLKTKIKPVFKKQAPKLVLGKVTCVLPKSGALVHCKAHFSYPSAHANIVYAINARLKETGAITWTTTTHRCTDAKTGKKLAC